MEEVRTQLQTAQKEAKAFVDKDIAELKGLLSAQEPSPQAYARILRERLKKLDDRTSEGRVESLDEAQEEYKAVKAEQDRLAKALAAFDALPLDDSQKQKNMPRILDARGVEQIWAIINSLKPALPKDEEIEEVQEGYYGASGGGSRSNLADLDEKWEHERLRLRSGVIAAVVAAYVLALLIGFVAFYVVSPTFGSDPLSYITLLLWGVGTNVLGTKTIDLTQVYESTKGTRQVNAPAPRTQDNRPLAASTTGCVLILGRDILSGVARLGLPYRTEISEAKQAS